MSDSARNSDVVVLSGGVIGLSYALYLLRAGRSVTVLAQGPAGREAAHGR